MRRVWTRCFQRGPGAAPLVLLLMGAAPSQREAVDLVGLFDRVCLTHAGDVGAAREAARGLRPMRAPRLMVRPGVVFDASTAAGHMALLLFDDGTCGAVADDADAGVLLGELAAQMKRRRVAVRPVGSGRTGGYAYMLQGGNLNVALMVDMQPVEGRTQVSMMARDGR